MTPIVASGASVASARVGFNDKLTMGSWGQGARSALPMVGEVFQQALKKGWIDQKAEFAIPRPKPKPPPEPEELSQPQGPGPQEIFNGVMERLRDIFR